MKIPLIYMPSQNSLVAKIIIIKSHSKVLPSSHASYK